MQRVHFDINITTYEIPAVDRSMRSELFYSKRDIETFIAYHYMEEMIGLLAFNSEVPTQDPLISLLMGFGSDDRNTVAAKHRVRNTKKHEPREQERARNMGVSV